MESSSLAFYLLSGVLCGLAVLVISLKNPVSAAMALVMHLFLLAGLYATLGAEFVAAIQVLVYAGAILVLFLFVIMLLNLSPEELTSTRKSFFYKATVILSGVLFLGAFCKLCNVPALPSYTATFSSENQDPLFHVGFKLFTDYLWPFEWASFLILLSVVASVVIAKKKKSSDTVSSS